MKCAIYRRVSTEMQREEGYSLEAQKSRLLSYIESQGWELTEDYADEGVSAKDIERPALQRLLADMAAGKFEVLLVYRLDRLVRSVTDLHNLLTLFEKHNVKFKSATEVFDTTSAMGRLFITMVGAMAQWERENLAERVSMGMMKRHEEGQRNGAAAPFGYDIGENGVLTINEDEAKWVRYIFESFKKKGRRMLAVELNNAGVRTKRGDLWNDFGLNYVVTNPVYYGGLRWNYRKANGARTYEETIVTGEHEAIITKELFDEVQAIRAARKGTGYRSDTHYPYSGVLKCARCGKTMIGAKRKRKDGYQRFYRCRGRFTYGICDMPIIPESVIDEVITQRLPYSDLTRFAKPFVEVDIDTEAINKELERLNAAASRLKQMFKWGDIDDAEYRAEMDTIKQRREELEAVTADTGGNLSAKELEQAVTLLSKSWSKLTFEERKNAIGALLDSITVEVMKEVAGAPGKKPEIEITDYQWR
jgi:site-specific DNA recombinase